MITHRFQLKDGFPAIRNDKEVRLKTVELRELTAGDVFDAQEASEKVIYNAAGDPVAFTSNVLVGINTLCRQIVRIDDYQGPMDIKDLRKLSVADLELIQAEADKLDNMVFKEIEQRGRTETAAGQPGDMLPVAGETTEQNAIQHKETEH